VTATPWAFDARELDGSLVDRFERQVASGPDRVAVGDSTRTLTYAELDREANHIARALLALSPQRQDTVGLWLGHEAAMIAAIWGVLKAGKIYVPLDPALPAARIAHLVEDAQARAIVTDAGHALGLASLPMPRPEIVDLDALATGSPAPAPAIPIPADDLCYLLYTSGSTGEPKGVPHRHRNVLADIRRQARDLRVEADDRYALLFSCSSSASVSSIFGALLNGASVWLFDLRANGLAGLPRWLDDRAITICDFSVGTFRQVTSMLAAGGGPPALRLMSLGGEVVTRRDVDLFREHFSPGCVLQNAMGCTEARMITQYFVDRHTELDGPTVPVGHAVAGKRVLVLDEQRRPVPPGEVGEIAVQSEYLSPGYWGQPELTDAVFLPDPAGGGARIYLTGDVGRQREDGCLVHLGRKDSQVKVRGYRIETAEVEMALLSVAEVADAFVAADRDETGEGSLVAYVVPAGRPGPTVSALRAALARTLPIYMVPRAFVLVGALPRTLSGKVDRTALPPAPRVRPALDHAYVAPRNPMETVIARLWEEVLDIEGVGVEDDFLDLGGDSLLASRILNRIAEVCGVEPPVVQLLAGRTVAQLAVEVLDAQTRQLDWEALERALGERQNAAPS
jgi:amino acid adenylation domain-containing protein